MNKITFINKDFFKSHKKITLISALLGGTILINFSLYKISDSQYLSYTAKIKDSRQLDFCFCEYEPGGNFGNQILDKIVWEEDYENTEPKAYCPSYLDSNVVKIVIFKGSSHASHYRITFKDTALQWIELPENNIIEFNLQNIPEQLRYGQNIYIQFGSLNHDLGNIEENNKEFLLKTINSKEEMEKHEQIHRKIISIANNIVHQNDSDFEKVKKIYDFLISHTEYRYSKEGIYGQALFNKYYMDCAGYTEFMNLALNNIGIECFSAEDHTHGHVWNIVKIDNKYYHLDATYSDTSSWYSTSRYRYFLVSDDYMLADHRFFVSEKNIKCNDIYDLTGLVSEEDIKYRGFKGEQIKLIKDGHKIGKIIDSGYSLRYRSK